MLPIIASYRDDETVAFSEARELVGARPEARLVPVERAGHTFNVGHPFTGSSPELDRAVEATVSHLGRTLEP